MSEAETIPAPSDLSAEQAAVRASELREEIRRHSELYYNDEPEISDAEFDALEAELRELQEAFPELRQDTPLQEVGAKASGLFSDVRHNVPMLSLDKAHTPEELGKFVDKFPGQRMALWPKFDGVSLSLLYEDGELVRAATRGDGNVGEDITANVKGYVDQVPDQLTERVTCEVRGEVVMLKSDFEAYNASVDDESKRLVNPRNAVSGTIRAKDREKVKDRKATFMAFDLVGYAPAEGRTLADELTELGFVVEGYREAETAEEIEAYIAELEENRDSLNYEVDGVVIKLADRAAYEAQGVTSHHPRGALAYKLAAEVQETTLEDLTWQVGKSGVVAPVAEVRPVFVAGTTIRRASLHNLSLIAERDIRIGDRIKIKRAGDVIPHVIGPADPSRRSGSEQVIEAPDSCPSCGGPLIEVGESRILQCENVQGCPAQQLRRLIHWGSRAAADIDAVGEKWIEKMVDAGLLSTPSDFYALTAEQLLETFEGQRMGEKLAERMIASIESSKELGLRKAIIGFAIPLSSEGTAKRLCRNGYESIEQVASATQEELEQVEDVGPAVAESLVKFFGNPETVTEIEALRANGVNLDVLDEDRPVEVADDAAYLGKTVCITGTLSVPRSEFRKILEGAGAKVTGSVSSKTDILVAGEEAGSKLAKAEKLGIEILSEDEARSRIQ